ncbi:MAG: tetratricopeptide repeat-containing diguanylate cyclase [Pseudomonadota bacterium]
MLRFETQRIRSTVALLLLLITAAALAAPFDEELERCRAIEDDQPAEAIRLGGEIVAAAQAAGAFEAAVAARGCLGWGQALTGKGATARATAMTMVEIVEGDLPPTAASVDLLRRAGAILHRIGDRLAATDIYARALGRAVALENTEAQIPLLINLAVLHSEFEQHGRAVRRYEEALSLMEESGDFRFQPPVLYNLGLTLRGMGDHAAAVAYLERVEAMIDENWPVSRAIDIKAAMAGSLIQLGEVDRTRALVAELRPLLEQIDSATSRAAVLSIEGALAGAAGDGDRAIELAEDAIEALPGDEGLYEVQRRGLLLALSGTYRTAGAFEQALASLDEVRDLERRLNRSANTQRMAEMEALLANTRQRQELIDLRHRNELSELELARERSLRRASLGGAVLLVVLIGVAWLWQRRMNGQLLTLSRTDILTGLPNRRAMMARLNTPTTASRVLWAIDLDHFKTVNDQHGHETGDRLLEAIGRNLAGLAGSTLMIGRWGGEEFLAIGDGIGEGERERVSDALQRAVTSAGIERNGLRIAVTASIGHATTEAGEDWATSLNRADSALYKVKAAGRNAALAG